MELQERFAQGDLEAFETLFRQFQGEVYRWIVRIVRNPAAAEDLTVETFWRIYRAHARFDPTRSFGAWARRIATNAALDHLRTARREVSLPENLSHGSIPQRGTHRALSLSNGQGTPPDSAVQQDVRNRIERAFRELPAKLRVVATLALIEEKPYEEIAEALGISVGAVKTRVFRAVRRLREKLKRMGVEP